MVEVPMKNVQIGKANADGEQETKHQGKLDESKYVYRSKKSDEEDSTDTERDAKEQASWKQLENDQKFNRDELDLIKKL